MDGIAAELRAWYYTGLRIAIWGGAGASADFLEIHGLDAHRFRMIRYLDWLLENPVDIILIPSEYRAADIVHQIDAARIAYDGILIPRDGHLVDFHATELVFA
jgi:hypothetical protein